MTILQTLLTIIAIILYAKGETAPGSQLCPDAWPGVRERR